MSILNTNKLTWFKNGGEPLKSGYVYVGQAGLDPQEPANQKTVTFTDSQGNESTAPQPLRTDTNGRVQWNGKAIIASVEGDYSLLLLDSNQTQIEAGWTPTVDGSNGGTTDLDDYREYALTLADVKQVDVSPGETIGNIGNLTATDGAGSDWLVVSNTGGTADDIDLIDFDNGLQGQRIRNNLQPQDNLDGLDDNATARSNIDVYSTGDTYSATEIDDKLTAMTTLDGVGSSSFLFNNTGFTVSEGSTVNVTGTQLRYAWLDSGGNPGNISGAYPTGVWRAMSYCPANGNIVFTKVSS